ncbi:sulfatase [Ruficoccus sp. ZRK36]|uniref:sulfatase family protein n=1 Tax=Ruficoccus sp. ZRK36 TaxID=2866311 RepID=UPI001C72A67D|nr:sulfatase [Ruficoccus sp. ZRK36]QYY35517.1 sulfatase [Ruficoccus sp. ZRK36]
MPIKNVLLIIADDWSPIAGCYGDTIVKTPHIDALAARALRFDNAFCTTPSCAASRANILTGQYSHTHGQYGHCHGVHAFNTLPGIKTLPAMLKDTGITTALAGKTHFAPDAAYPFDFRQELMSPELAKFSNRRMADAVEECFNFVGDSPFYMHAATGYPHRIGGDFDPELAAREFGPTDATYSPEEIPVPAWLPGTPEVRRDLCEYYRYITRFDNFVGNTLASLDKHGSRDETLVILLSDHGMPFPGAKASSFEAGHLCPLIIAHPDGPQGASTDALVNWTDLLPTILEALGQPIPEDLTGRSLMPLLDQPDAPGWDAPIAYSHSFHEITNYFPYRALRGPRYKYACHLALGADMPLPTDLYDAPSYKSIEETGGSEQRTHKRLLRHEREALYDLQNDPYETVNLIDEPSLQDIRRDYAEQLTQLRIRTSDPWLEVDFQDGMLPSRVGDLDLAKEKAVIA